MLLMGTGDVDPDDGTESVLVLPERALRRDHGDLREAEGIPTNVRGVARPRPSGTRLSTTRRGETTPPKEARVPGHEWTIDRTVPGAETARRQVCGDRIGSRTPPPGDSRGVFVPCQIRWVSVASAGKSIERPEYRVGADRPWGRTGGPVPVPMTWEPDAFDHRSGPDATRGGHDQIVHRFELSMDDDERDVELLECRSGRPLDFPPRSRVVRVGRDAVPMDRPRSVMVPARGSRRRCGWIMPMPDASTIGRHRRHRASTTAVPPRDPRIRHSPPVDRGPSFLRSQLAVGPWIILAGRPTAKPNGNVPPRT